MISKRRWMTPHPGFSTEAPGPNGMNVTTALPSRRFRRDKFRASIPLRSPISFHPSLETGNVTTQSDRRHQRWMWIDLSTASITVCSCHSCPPFHAPTFSNFVYPASENQACLPPIALDSQMGPALQLFHFCFLQPLRLRRFILFSPGAGCGWFSSFSRAPDSHMKNVIGHLQTFVSQRFPNIFKTLP